MYRIILLLIYTVLAVSICCADENAVHSFKTKNGFVPDAQIAIKIAVAVWEPIYGKDLIAKEKPFKVRLDSGKVWVVQGSLLKGRLGGVAVAEIAKIDGRILRVSHGK